MFDRPFWQSIGLRPSLDEERRNINYTPLKRRSAAPELPYCKDALRSRPKALGHTATTERGPPGQYQLNQIDIN